MRCVIPLVALALVACNPPPRQAVPAPDSVAPSRSPSKVDDGDPTPPSVHTPPRIAPPLPPGLTIQIEQVTRMLSGPLPTDLMQRLVVQHFHEVTFCYERGLAFDHSLHGETTFHIVVASGAVMEVHAMNAPPDAAEATGCAEQVIRTWTFPPLPATTEFEIDVTYAPRHNDGLEATQGFS